jgi:nucleoside-diphosphate-sugar epimerase
MPLIGGGRNRTQPVWADDLIGGLLRCADTAATGVFHFAGPAALTTRSLLRTAARAMGAREPRWNLPLPLARAAAAFCEGALPVSLRRLPIDSSKVDFFQVEHVYSNRRAEELLGWRPAMDWPDGAAEVARALLAETRPA